MSSACYRCAANGQATFAQTTGIRAWRLKMRLKVHHVDRMLFP